MNASYQWLRALLPGLQDTPQQVADRLALYGAPVDELVALAEGLEGVRIARVLDAVQHPNADRLRLCQVDAGTGEVLSVVCGAPNVRAGGIYPFAPVGATLPGGITIRQAKIRGEVSQGMLCSPKELGLGRDHSGLMELHGDFEPGQEFVGALGLDDVRLVVDITANRPDLLSHIGLARELADGAGAVRLPELPGGMAATVEALPVERVETQGRVGGVTVRVEDREACPRYIAAVVRGVRVGPSPEWLATRLRAVGLRPINNVVDATNYVLYELGQPLHAFDLARLAGPAIVVRPAVGCEPITTLDGVARELEADMLVIADAERPVAVAGVIGGEDSEVRQETTDILLECALFEPKRTRALRRVLGVSTDASYRFERGVDPEGMERAARRAIELILATAGGTVDGGLLDIDPEPLEPLVVALRPARVLRVLGRRFSDAELESLLAPLGFVRAGADDDTVRFRVPGARRYDVYREIDLIEEVARRHGYDAFDADMGPFRPTRVPTDPMAQLESRLRARLAGLGFLEARSAAFAPETEGQIGLLNPLSMAESHMRSALVPGLVHAVETNFAHGVRNVRLFEIGTVFSPATAPAQPPEERTRLAMVFTGARTPPHWTAESPPFDVWDLKGVVVEVVRSLGLEPSAVEPETQGAGWLAAGLGFRVVAGERVLGTAGQVDPARIDAPAWAGAVWAFEVDLLPSMTEVRHAGYVALPAHPAVERDLALLLPAGLAAEQVREHIREAGGALLETAWPFDVFVGQGVPEGMRSVAFRLRFRAADRTLTDPEVDKAVDRVLRRLREELGVERRS